MAQGDQFRRKLQLLVTSNGASYGPASFSPGFSGTGSAVTPVDLGNLTATPAVLPRGVDLSELRFRFSVRASDTQTPNTAIIRVYNIAPTTIQTIIDEYTNVILSAGYTEGNYGIVFSGTVKQFERGKESNIDSYLEMRCADTDLGYNFAWESGVSPAGVNYAQRYAQTVYAMGTPQDPNGSGDALIGGVMPRGKVKFGLARNYARQIASANDGRWSIQNGYATFIPNTGYLTNQVVVLNSATGMVGVPRATDQGIEIDCLLNPLIKIGCSVSINNRDITQTVIKDRFYPNYTGSATYVANTSTDGVYRVMVAEHDGDTRGGPLSWLTHLICLNINPGTQQDNAVAAW